MQSNTNDKSIQKLFATTINYNEGEAVASCSTAMQVDNYPVATSPTAVPVAETTAEISTAPSNEIRISGPNEDVLRVLQDVMERLHRIELNAVQRSEILAQNQLIRECKVSIRKVESSVCKMTGEIRDKLMDDVASALPLQNSLAVLRLEEKLKSAEYAQAMTTHLYKIKGISENIPNIVREIFTDELMEEYNWSGVSGKKALEKLSLFETFLRDVFTLQGHSAYEKGVKKAVELSHHRMAQRKFAKKSKTERNQL